MPKPESFPIEKIYVPVKRKKAIKPEVAKEIAESILEIGQQAPILIRPDEGRFVLVEGLHRLEACKALGETTIIGILVSVEPAQKKCTRAKVLQQKPSATKWRDLKSCVLRRKSQTDRPLSCGALAKLSLCEPTRRKASATIPRQRQA